MDYNPQLERKAVDLKGTIEEITAKINEYYSEGWYKESSSFVHVDTNKYNKPIFIWAGDFIRETIEIATPGINLRTKLKPDPDCEHDFIPAEPGDKFRECCKCGWAELIE